MSSEIRGVWADSNILVQCLSHIDPTINILDKLLYVSISLVNNMSHNELSIYVQLVLH